MSIVNIVYVIALIIVVAMIYSKLKNHNEEEIKQAYLKGMQDAIDYIELMSDNTQEEADAIKGQMLNDIQNSEDK